MSRVIPALLPALVAAALLSGAAPADAQSNSRRQGRADQAQAAKGERDDPGGSPAFRNGYRDGLTKGRHDFETGDGAEVGRHAWYRLATRGYENRLGTRYEYIDRYRRGFEAGYRAGYRTYTRR